MIHHLISGGSRWRFWLRCLALVLPLLLGTLGLEAALPAQAAPVPADPEFEDDAPWLFGLLVLFMALVVLAAALILVGIGIVLGIAALAIGSVMVAVGAISASVLVGVLSKSPASGFRTLFVLIGTAAGLPCGIAGSYLVVWLSSEFALENIWWPVLGGICGMAAGLVVALIFNLAWSKAARALRSRLSEFRAKNAPQPVLHG